MDEEENETFPSSLFCLQSCLPSHFFYLLSFSPHQTANSCFHNKRFKCNLSCLHKQSGPFSYNVSHTELSFFLLIMGLNRSKSCGQFSLTSLPFVCPVPIVLKISENATQGSRTKISSPKSIVPQWLTGVLEEGLADKILIGCLEGWGQMVNVG